jgi:hypothetical protein
LIPLGFQNKCHQCKANKKGNNCSLDKLGNAKISLS